LVTRDCSSSALAAGEEAGSFSIHFCFGVSPKLIAAHERVFFLSEKETSLCLLACSPFKLKVLRVAQMLWPTLDHADCVVAYRRCINQLECSIGLRVFSGGMLHDFSRFVAPDSSAIVFTSIPSRRVESAKGQIDHSSSIVDEIPWEIRLALESIFVLSADKESTFCCLD